MVDYNVGSTKFQLNYRLEKNEEIEAKIKDFVIKFVNKDRFVNGKEVYQLKDVEIFIKAYQIPKVSVWVYVIDGTLFHRGKNRIYRTFFGNERSCSICGSASNPSINHDNNSISFLMDIREF